MSIIKYCKVIECRFAWSHVTQGHRCGKCGRYGHGEVECGNRSLINDLHQLSANDQLPHSKHCQMRYCSYRWSHETIAHYCRFCHLNHNCSQCLIGQTPFIQNHEAGDMGPATKSLGVSPSQNHNILIIECPICRAKNQIKNDQKLVFGIQDECVVCKENNAQIYFPACGHVCVCQLCSEQMNQSKPPGATISTSPSVITENQLEQSTKWTARNKMGVTPGAIVLAISVGQGCSWFIRRNDVGSPLEGFFMHGDCWGQYGPETDHRPQLTSFKRGYTMIDDE